VRTPYKINRYSESKILLINNEASIYKNPDVALEYQISQPNNYFIDVNLTRLDRLSSDGTTIWTSYNWVLVKKPDNNYNLIFSKSNNDESEIGLKHSYIGSPNKLIFSGECRIIVIRGKTLYQFNTNSSSAPSYEIPNVDYVNIFEYQLIKIKKILQLYLTNIQNEQVQVYANDNLGLGP
jgi:hypothetical protein